MVETIRTYSDEYWHLRSTRVGASELGALFGVSPFTSPAEVWANKNAEVQHSENPINSRMWWGHQEEPAIIEAAKYETWGEDFECQTKTGFTFYTDALMASPDAVIEYVDPYGLPLRSCIEAKTVGRSQQRKWKQGPPTHVKLQAYAQQMLTESEFVVVAARICGDPVKVWNVYSDYDDVINEVVARFWKTDEKPEDWEDWIAALTFEYGLWEMQ